MKSLVIGEQQLWVEKVKQRTKRDGYLIQFSLDFWASNTAALKVASASGAPTLNLNWRQEEPTKKKPEYQAKVEP